MNKRKKLTVVDLFAGCGGLSLGLESAKFVPVYVNELNDNARETFFLNRERRHPLIRKYSSSDIRSCIRDAAYFDDLCDGLRRDYGITSRGSVDLVVGGPPCQGFSSLGLRRSYPVEKRRLPPNHLYRGMARFISELRPKAFLFENVQGLLSSRWTADGCPGEIFDDVLRTFKRLDRYSVKHAVLYSKNYGVPQMRPRVFIVGFRFDVYGGTSGIEDAVEGGFLPPPSDTYLSMEDVLSDLVDPRFTYGGSTTRYPRRPRSAFQLKMRSSFSGRYMSGLALEDHEYSDHSERIRRKFAYMIETNGKIRYSDRTKKFRQRVIPRSWGPGGPNMTITSMPDDFVHYQQPRSLTVRECARIQTFPDWYRFVGPRTTGGTRRAGNPIEGIFDRELPKYTQIGNAVPVELASRIGRHLADIIF